MECEWKYDDNADYWETSCGETFVFTAGKPLEDNFFFCPYCGKRIVPKRNARIGK